MRGHSGGSHEDARAARTRAWVRATYGEAFEAKRAAEIDALPVVIWRGPSGLRAPVRRYTITCGGSFGRGPHTVNVSAHWLWHVLHLHLFRCQRHQGGS